jgi:hypothetical protein
LTFVLLHRVEGCIYRLDLGTVHPNLDGTLIGEKHKHRWSEGIGVKDAYAPEDITATLDDPVGVWEQFCTEEHTRVAVGLAPPRSTQRLPRLIRTALRVLLEAGRGSTRLEVL